MNELTDMELVELARNDNEEAKEILFKRSKEVISYSIRKTKLQCWGLNKADVEDLVSECHIAVMEAIKLYSPNKGAAFPHFLKFVIRTRLYKYVNNRIERSENIAEGVKLENIRAAEDITRDLTIKVKNPRDKYIIELFLAGMRQTDIADELRISRQRVNEIIKGCIK